MTYGLYISAAGAQAQSERLQTLSQNLANVDTVGYKPDFAVIQARYSESIERGDSYAGSRTMNDIGGGVDLTETVTEYSLGTLKQTGIPTDLALPEPDTFFVVEQEGRPLLTRAGNFQFNGQGQLVTQQGHPVQSTDGGPIVIDPRLPWQIEQSGVISQSGLRTPLAIVKPNSLGDLAKVGGNMFRPLAEARPVEEADRRVLVEHLEQSAVNPVSSMMELIEASRAYEANINLIQNQDEMLGSLLSRMLRQ